MSRIALWLILSPLLAFAPAHAAEDEITVAEYLRAWDAMDHTAVQAEYAETGTVDFSKNEEARITILGLQQTANAYRASVEADRAAGRTPDSCLPEGKADLNTSDLVPHLRSYENPEEVTLAKALSDAMRQTYPCE